MTFSFLSGGTGTPKLLQGFRELVDDRSISVICNTGDDLTWNGLHVSPDLDTVLYLFSEKLDTDKFWGVKNEEFTTLDVLKSLGIESWFGIGNKDLGLHLFRQLNLSKLSLTEISALICNQWNISATILPMCDQPVMSRISTPIGILPFQEYFVKHHYNLDVFDVVFEGDKSKTSSEVLNAIRSSNQVIIGPSNPVTSIGPILSVDPLRNAMKSNRNKNLAVSPIKTSSAFSGPTATLMRAMHIEVSVVGLAKHYQELISKLIISPDDKHLSKAIEDYDIEPIVLPIELKTSIQKLKLAQQILEVI